MYMTRPLSVYRNCPSALSIQAPEAPFSGYLVVRDEESEAQDTFCWGVLKTKRVTKLPFPQDQILKVVHSSEHEGQTSVTKVWFIPVLDQPLSSNRYYVIRAKGKYKGKVCACSSEDDIGRCCFSEAIIDVKPRPFDHRDIYQQVEIHCHHNNGAFYAKSIARDGFPPKFLRRKGWEVHTSNSFHLQLREAQGLNTPRLLHLPDFNFPLPRTRSAPVVIGKWYCPFVFVKEELKHKDQMKRSSLYEMALEQWWEEIYSSENENNESNTVTVNASVQREESLVYGMEAVKDDQREGDDGFMWFRVHDQCRRRRVGVGLSLAIVEKMRWVEERGGWVGGGERNVRVERGGERNVRVERVEENRSESGWQRFGCYVLVQSFVLRRLDGRLLLNCKFRHIHKIKCKWD
ncbi:uncharacterized protein LOC132298750 [Cornus florida]|uniref:uncharacterized protein LOC132298750 n=1 Tax=Cornus florida TaxID=4283 RepID=UPI00289E8A12|nr:uncharacterized protein LOC132298750 [Cornus florida]